MLLPLSYTHPSIACVCMCAFVCVCACVCMYVYVCKSKCNLWDSILCFHPGIKLSLVDLVVRTHWAILLAPGLQLLHFVCITSQMVLWCNNNIYWAIVLASCPRASKIPGTFWVAEVTVAPFSTGNQSFQRSSVRFSERMWRKQAQGERWLFCPIHSPCQLEGLETGSVTRGQWRHPPCL